MQITATATHPMMYTRSASSAAAITSPEVEAQTADIASISEVERFTASVAGYTLGAVGSMVGMVANGAAGGARGLVKGAELEGQTADNAFQVAFAANLAVAGAIAYGASSAVAMVASGEAAWAQQPQELRAKVFASVDTKVDEMLAQFPPADQHSIGRRIGQAVVGEMVGMTVGAFAGAQGGYQVGAEFGQIAVHGIAAKFRAALA